MQRDLLLLGEMIAAAERATQLSDDIKERFPGIPWQQPARLRNRIVHGYWSIDLDILHTTATDQLPSFARDLRQILGTLTADEHTAAASPEAAAPAASEQPQDLPLSDSEG